MLLDLLKLEKNGSKGGGADWFLKGLCKEKLGYSNSVYHVAGFMCMVYDFCGLVDTVELSSWGWH